MITKLTSIACMFFACGARATTDDEIFDTIVEASVNCDAVPRDGFSASVSNSFAWALEKMGVDERGFLDRLGAYATNRCLSAATYTNEDSLVQLGCALYLLSEFGAPDDLWVQWLVVTNSISDQEVSNASYHYVMGTGLSEETVDLYLGSGINSLPESRRTQALDGMWSSFYHLPQSQTLSNRVVGVCLELLRRGCFLGARTDGALCRFWPEYGNSSNRYLNVCAALEREADVPASNYFHCAKASLEALPPGTMQLLSTNRFALSLGGGE